MKTDIQDFLMGDYIYLHQCDSCEQMLHGLPYAYWEHKDFTLCFTCLTELTDELANPNRNGSSDNKRKSQYYKKQQIPDELRWKIFNRDNFTCQYCGSRMNLVVDHILPESRGGTLKEDNLATACRACNAKKGVKTPEESGMPLLHDTRNKNL